MIGWEGRVEGMRKEGREGDPKGWFTPHVRNPEKYPDCRTDLIGRGGNTDLCPGRQTPRAATDAALLLINRLKTNMFLVNVPLQLLSPEAF